MILFGIFYKKEYLTLTSQYSDFVDKLERHSWTLLQYQGYSPIPDYGIIKFYTSGDKLYIKTSQPLLKESLKMARLPYPHGPRPKTYQVALTFKGSDAFLHLVDADGKLGTPLPISISNDTLYIDGTRYVF